MLVLVLTCKKVSSLAVKIEKRRLWHRNQSGGKQYKTNNAYRFDGVSLRVQGVDDFSVLRGLLLLGYENAHRLIIHWMDWVFKCRVSYQHGESTSVCDENLNGRTKPFLVEHEP